MHHINCSACLLLLCTAYTVTKLPYSWLYDTVLIVLSFTRGAPLKAKLWLEESPYCKLGANTSQMEGDIWWLKMGKGMWFGYQQPFVGRSIAWRCKEWLCSRLTPEGIEFVFLRWHLLPLDYTLLSGNASKMITVLGTLWSLFSFSFSNRTESNSKVLSKYIWGWSKRTVLPHCATKGVIPQQHKYNNSWLWKYNHDYTS